MVQICINYTMFFKFVHNNKYMLVVCTCKSVLNACVCVCLYRHYMHMQYY